MGRIKFKELLIYEGPLAEFRVHSNWCNSMAEYYPYISIAFVNGSGSGSNSNEDIKWARIMADEFVSLEQEKLFSVELDQTQVDDLNRILKANREKEETQTIRLHKLVKVVRGRKVPIGTEGEVFWLGDNGFGMTVGLRLRCGKKIFTAMKNVETTQLDEAFETEVLGLKK